MKFLTTTVLLLLFIGTSCCTTSKSKKPMAEDKNSAINMEKMTEAGFIQGTIVASEAEDDCPYVIKSEISGNTVMYDPINLDDSFKKDGMKVWYKYNGLKMMNRCEKASPVNVAEMQKM